MARLPSYRTGNDAVDERLVEVLDAVGAERDRDQLFEILVSGVRLAADRADRLDLKIANAALKEMRAAYNVFAPYREVPKVTIFGSARTKSEDPLYAQTAQLARALAGGFGTLDETFELLTLVQTGKAVPVPIVLLDTPSGRYWESWQRFVDEAVLANGMIDAEDRRLYCITDAVERAVAE